jgi:uncharacterized membrane protein
MCVHDAFVNNFFSFTCYDTVSYYDTTLISHLIYYCDISHFYRHGIYNTTYNTHIGASLSHLALVTNLLVYQANSLACKPAA